MTVFDVFAKTSLMETAVCEDPLLCCRILFVFEKFWPHMTNSQVPKLGDKISGIKSDPVNVPLLFI